MHLDFLECKRDFVEDCMCCCVGALVCVLLCAGEFVDEITSCFVEAASCLDDDWDYLALVLLMFDVVVGSSGCSWAHVGLLGDPAGAGWADDADV